VAPGVMRALLIAPIECWGWRFVEGVGVVVAAALASIGAFLIPPGGEGMALALAFAPLPLVLYSAVRIGQANASICIAVIAAVLLTFTRHQSGPFVILITHPEELVVALQSYLAILAASAMLLGASALTARRTSRALAESEANYKTFVAQSSEGVWRVALPEPVDITLPPDEQARRILGTGRMAECNDAMARMYGAASAQVLVGLPVKQLLVPEDPRNIDYLRRFIASGYRLENAVSHECGLDGSELIFSNSLIGVIEEGRLAGAWGTQRDITATRSAQQALEQSERRWRALIETAPHVTIQGYDVQGRVLFWNPASERVFGYTAQQAMGRTLDELIFDRPVAALFAELLKKMEADGLPSGPTQWPFRRADGRTGVLMSSIFVAPGADGRTQFVCMDYDVTEQVAAQQERHALEAQLHRTQKLESLGVMAGGVAHDFNNLLVGVLGNASLAISQLSADHPAAATLRNVQDAARRAAELTRQLLAYAGKAGGSKKVIDVADVLSPMLPLVRSMINSAIEVTFHQSPSVPKVLADSTQIEQVLLNLVTNAAEAISDQPQPRISISIEPVRLSAEELASEFMPVSLTPGSYACLVVEDNGKGMTREVRDRLFDPFFSTKFTGRGLGLAVVLGIIRGHGGGIGVVSAPGAGTRFRIILPASTDQAIAVNHDSFIEPKTMPSLEPVHALVVDDESMVADVLRLSLENLGWHVDVALSGDKALELLDHETRHKVAIVDVTMPGMSGPALAAKLRERRPQLTILLSSGYATENLTDIPEGIVDGFIAKPFTSDSLLDALMQALSTRAHN